MKKLICVLLSVLMILTAITLVSCGKEENLKFGLGVYTTSPSSTSADGDANGQGKVTTTAAALTVDKDGKVVACDLDTSDITVAFTSEGKGVANDGFKTKAEQGKDYNMVAYGGATKEWYEQANAFETLIVGKTLDEIKALVAEGNKGTEEVVNAGCTIMINEFVSAIEKAFANLADSTATAAHSVKLGVSTEQSLKDAVEDVIGYNQVETTIVAAAVDADGKMTAVASNCVQVQFSFNTAGETMGNVKTDKREAGANYGMVAYGGAAKEWFEQADAFNATCIGKTAGDVNALMGADNYGNEDLKAAGCTILVNGFVKAAAKLG